MDFTFEYNGGTSLPWSVTDGRFHAASTTKQKAVNFLLEIKARAELKEMDENK